MAVASDMGRRTASVILVLAAVLAGVSAARASDVNVVVKDGPAIQKYAAPWSDHMTVLDAMRQALPTSSEGSFALRYFPQYDGYIVSAVAGKPMPGGNAFWSTCLLPSGPGSSQITLPLGPDRILVGPNDTVSLVFNAPCGPGNPGH